MPIRAEFGASYYAVEEGIPGSAFASNSRALLAGPMYIAEKVAVTSPTAAGIGIDRPGVRGVVFVFEAGAVGGNDVAKRGAYAVREIEGKRSRGRSVCD